MGVGEGCDPGLRLVEGFEGLVARGEVDLVEAMERFEGIRGTLLVRECPRGRPGVGYAQSTLVQYNLRCAARTAGTTTGTGSGSPDINLT